MNIFVIDACAWIEYFNASKSGEYVKKIVENSENTIYTNIITIAELSSSYTRNKLSFENEKNTLLQISSLFNVDLLFCDEVGKLHAETKQKVKNLSLSDAFVLLTARKVGGKIVTCDEDFRGIKEAIMIK